jgi:lysophospholipase
LPDGEAQWVTARSGRRLRAVRFEPAGTPRGTVVVSTGRTEPLEKYGEVATELVARGYVALLHDWAGQGLSARFGPDPMRGDVIGGPDALLDDYHDVLAAFDAELPRPWLALAHSMGGALTALDLIQGESRFAGACLCSPMLQFSVGKLPFSVVRTVVKVANLGGRGGELARREADPVDITFEQNLLTHDRGRFERTRALYRAHPELQLGAPTWRWLSFAVSLRDRLLEPGAAARIACPVACVGAGNDRIVESSTIRDFCARIPRGAYTEVPGAYHEILMERDERRALLFRVFDELAERTRG